MEGELPRGISHSPLTRWRETSALLMVVLQPASGSLANHMLVQFWKPCLDSGSLDMPRPQRPSCTVALSPPGRSPVSATQADSSLLAHYSRSLSFSSRASTLTWKGFSGQGRSLPQGQGCSESPNGGWKEGCPGWSLQPF